MQSLCEACNHIDWDPGSGNLRQRSSVRRPALIDKVELGSVTNVLGRRDRCDLCSLIADTLTPDIPGMRHVVVERRTRWSSVMECAGYASEYIERVVDDHSWGKTPPFPGCDTWFYQIVISGPEARNGGPFLLGDRLELVPMDDMAELRQHRQFRERLLCPTGPDFDLLRSWLSICLTEHAELCGSRPTTALEPPERLRVIDVQGRCVVAAPPDCVYAALSYVWGGPQSLATAEDLRELPWPLPDHLLLSKVVEDGMNVCKELGIHFLWVDALCLAQQPRLNEDKAKQIAQMDRIYNSAVLTICAASSKNAAAGVIGLEHRRVQQPVFRFNNKLWTVSQCSPAKLIEHGVWNSRAWTYQERLLSRRTLFITEQQAFWNCQCDCWLESTIAEPTGPGLVGVFQTPKAQWTEYPEMHYGFTITPGLVGAEQYGGDDLCTTWTHMVSYYTGRQMTNHEDGLNGISGVLNALARFNRPRELQFLWGIPTSMFDLGLLWKPRTGYGRGEGAVQPSWSWTGCFSESGLGVEWDISDAFLQPFVRPAVDWHFVQRDGTSKSLACVNNAKLQPVCGIRIVDGQSALKPPLIRPDLLDRDGLLLHFLSTTAHFRVGSRLQWRDPEFHRPWIGNKSFLGAHTPECTENYPWELLDRNDVCVGHTLLCGPPVEAKAVAAFVFLSYAEEFDHSVRGIDHLRRPRPASSGSCEVVNCMMVETKRDSGISKRVTLGKITVEAWLAADPQTEWIVLG